MDDIESFDILETGIVPVTDEVKINTDSQLEFEIEMVEKRLNEGLTSEEAGEAQKTLDELLEKREQTSLVISVRSVDNSEIMSLAEKNEDFSEEDKNNFVTRRYIEDGIISIKRVSSDKNVDISDKERVFKWVTNLRPDLAKTITDAIVMATARANGVHQMTGENPDF